MNEASAARAGAAQRTEWGEAFLVGQIHVGVVIDQEVRHYERAELGGRLKRRPPLLIHHVDRVLVVLDEGGRHAKYHRLLVVGGAIERLASYEQWRV